LTETLKRFAISVMVYPSIFTISEYITERLNNIVEKPHLFNFCIGKFENIFKKCSGKIIFTLTNSYLCTTFKV
jgi:hypothetical protein